MHIVSENEIIKTSELTRDTVYSSALKEKEIRGVLKSESLRLLGTGGTVILDAGNYIKGYRYELYCATKGIQTTQVTVECCASEAEAWSWNTSRSEDERYSRETFDALIMRYEPPNSQNRWDSPLVVLQSGDQLPGQQICSLLYERKPPPPNMSTQSLPATGTTFVYDIDRITKELIDSIVAAKKMGGENSNIKLSGFEGLTVGHFGPNLTHPQLARLRRQFLQYTKLNPPSSNEASREKIAQLFIQYLTTVHK